MPSKTSLDSKLSDLVGSANYNVNNQFTLNMKYFTFPYPETNQGLFFSKNKSIVLIIIKQ